ncbi:hypothetical protein LOC67_09350 [Stieleria sp. JC731]|uniref:hypothetical protein n=1 Tax=Pirellulaceae TaxID=2691357 RepID=UPI001E4D2CA3|nr:hypothetical protein [Stieleria sp. JC731]MCC9600769.1 hypothetical protein [Stieleria sp. JC731]
MTDLIDHSDESSPDFEFIENQLDRIGAIIGSDDLDERPVEFLAGCAEFLTEHVTPFVELASNRMNRIHARTTAMLNRLVDAKQAIDAREAAKQVDGDDNDAKRG